MIFQKKSFFYKILYIYREIFKVITHELNMRFFFIFLTTLFILFLYSCSFNNNTQTGKKINVNESFKTFDTVVPFSGYWVSENYYKCLVETRSTRKAQEFAQSIFIPHRTLQITSMIYGFHEGSENICVIKNGNDYKFWSVPARENFYDIQIISENRIKIGDYYFIKLSNKVKNEKDYYFEEKLIGEFLLKGTYTANDIDVINFMPDGKITGVDLFSSYSILLDYFAPFDYRVDVIKLNNTQYGYKFGKDTLFIYDLKCSIEPNEEEICDLSFGELQYKLWKK